MLRLRHNWIAVSMLGALAVLAAVMNSNYAAAQNQNKNLAVTIVSPIPLPITGSTTVSGTVASTQNGLWNIRNLDDRGRVAYQAKLVTTTAPARLPAVPDGHRLVIEHISGVFNSVSTTTNPFAVYVELLKAGENEENIIGGIVPTLAPSNTFVTPFDQALLVYVNPGDRLEIGIGSIGGGAGILNVSGYMLDCTSAPCDPMAP